MPLTKHFYYIFFLLALTCSCQTSSKQKPQTTAETFQSQTPFPPWSNNAVLYEVNIRQYTPEGTLNAFEKHLPRLKKLGINTLWLMPIYPIGTKNRKGTLGSYYAINDYTKVNPEFGSIEDLKSLVRKAHELGMKVLLDWVANHTAWDHPWITKHPDWYKKNEAGEIIPPVKDWTDVAALNYENPLLREAMTDALAFWVSETDIDGFRCDVAGMVPVDFWASARTRLDSIKPLFMLAEDEENLNLLKRAFNANYGWSFFHLMNDVAKGEKDATALAAYFQKIDSLYPTGTYPMQFITNHDENSWNGTAPERLGDALLTMTALSFTVEGFPLIYSGQEAGLDKSLSFFEKDQIDWAHKDLSEFYKKLITLKVENPALWNGVAGGKMKMIPTDANKDLFCFSRSRNNHTVVALFNLTDKWATVCTETGPAGLFNNLFTGKKESLPFKGRLIQPWSFEILTNQ